MKVGEKFHHVRNGVKYRYKVIREFKAPTPKHNDLIELQDLDTSELMLVELEWFKQRDIKMGA